MKFYKFAQLVISTMLCVSALYAEQKPAALGQSDLPQAEANDIKFPYIGEITGSEINIRSGPGMNFYSSGKISSPARVIVVEQRFVWSRILPPQGSFSWVFKQYVQPDANRPGTGVISEDNVRIYAGADDREPVRSDSVQIMLNKGQKVKFSGEAIGDYYRIVPPEGATLWVSSQYVKFIRPADQLELTLPKVEPAAQIPAESAKPAALEEQKPLQQVQTENPVLLAYDDFKGRIEQEKQKPLAEQNFAPIKESIETLIAESNDANSGDYAKYLLKDIEKYTLIQQASIELEKQQQLKQTLEQIEQKKAEKVRQVSDLGRYAIIGTLKPSLAYQSRPKTKRFIINDDSGSPVCFAEPSGRADDLDLTAYFDKKVGLVGKIVVDGQSKLPLIKFDKIESLELE